MSTFANVLESRDRVPLRHVILGFESFAEDWQEKPIGGGEVALGLRKFSDADTQTARAEAAKFAVRMHDDHEGQVESFNDALMRWLIVRGTCDANDVTLNAPLFDGSEENVRNALTTQAIRFVYDEIERFHVEMSPVVHEATDDEFLELSELLKNPKQLSQMTIGAQKRIRKLLGFCLSELRIADTQTE